MLIGGKTEDVLYHRISISFKVVFVRLITGIAVCAARGSDRALGKCQYPAGSVRGLRGEGAARAQAPCQRGRIPAV